MIRSRFTMGLTFLLLVGLLVTTVPAGWKRVQRVPIYDAQKRARYPSLAKGNQDSLLLVTLLSPHYKACSVNISIVS